MLFIVDLPIKKSLIFHSFLYVYKRDMDDVHGGKPNISGCATNSRKSSKFRGPSSVAPLCAKAYARDETGQIHSNMVRTGI